MGHPPARLGSVYRRRQPVRLARGLIGGRHPRADAIDLGATSIRRADPFEPRDQSVAGRRVGCEPHPDPSPWDRPPDHRGRWDRGPAEFRAHYPGTAWPGSGSNIYIYAHARDGLFIKLWDAKEGDEVLLDTVDGRTATYIVDEIRPRTPWNALDMLEPTEREQLTLQTSTSYTATAPRFVVIALPGP